MIDLADIPRNEGLNPSDVNVIVHSPHSREGELLRLLPGVVQTRRTACEAPLTQSYVRLAEKLTAPVSAIGRESHFDAIAPGSKEMILRAPYLRALPRSCEARLRELRGVYLIVDERDGARYVGSASGAENMPERWRQHFEGDHGVTKGLSDRVPETFRFSILQLVASSASRDDVLKIEYHWMRRLDTVRHGLNEDMTAA